MGDNTPLDDNVINRNDEARIWGYDGNNWVELSVNNNGEIDVSFSGDNVGILDSSENEIDPATDALEDALKANDADEFITRVTDSGGTEVDPATDALENALKANDSDEFVTRVTDSTGTEIDPVTQALEDALKSNDSDELITRVTDSGGTEVDPLARQDTSPVTGSTSTATNDVTLVLGDYRKDVDWFVDVSGSATLTVEIRVSGGTWRTFDTVDYGSATTEVEQYSTSFAEMRASVDQNLNTLEGSSKGV